MCCLTASFHLVTKLSVTVQSTHVNKNTARQMSDADLERDLHSSPVIKEKVLEERYAQNLYAAMCNMQWGKATVWQQSAGELAGLDDPDIWSCSWRYAGGLVAELRSEGDYMDWYCSGIGSGEHREKTGFVSEGYVTNEIRNDLLTLGWYPVPWDDDGD